MSRPAHPYSATCSATAVCPLSIGRRSNFLCGSAESTPGPFMSYHPELPTFSTRVDPDPAYWSLKLDDAIPEFLRELKLAKQRLLDAGVTPKLEER